MSVHDKGIVHGNLKPENVLEKDTYGKIDGFRFAVREGTPGMRNTHGYIPAEFFSGGNFSSKSDIFSVGLMLLEILDNNSFMKVRTAQLNGEDGWKEIHDACLRLPEKDRLSELIRNMLELNPERRPSTNDAFNELLSIYNEM
jgi:serine/threonine protein kinase